MKLSIKNGVSLLGVQPIMFLAAIVVAGVYYTFDSTECVITSGTEGNHKGHSHHYKGLALDFRIRNIRPGWHHKLLRQTQLALTDEFQVVLSDRCLHVEYDPE